MRQILVTIAILLSSFLAWSIPLAHAEEEEKSSNELMRMGDQAYATGSYSAAVDSYRQALRRDEENWPARLKLIELLARLAGKEDEARREIETALAMEGLSEKEIELIAEICRVNRFPEQAKLAYERLLKENPGDVAVLGKLVGILLSQEHFKEAKDRVEAYRDNPASTVEGLEKLASACTERSAHGIAQIAYEAVLKRDEKNARALVGWGECLARSWRFSEAIAAVSRAVEYSPEKAEPRVALGELLLRTGDYAHAEKSFLKALENQPENVEAILGHAEVLSSTGRYEEAEQALSEAVTAQPDSPGLLVARGRVLHHTGEHESSREQFQKALAAKRDCAEAILGLGLGYREIGKADLAEEQFYRLYDFYDARIKDLGSVEPEDLLAVAIACALTDNPQDAVDVLEKVLKRDPTSAEAILWEARLFAERHQPADASRELMKLLDMNPNHAEAHAELANLYLEASKYEEATESCEKALKANPNLIRALDILCALQILDFEYEEAEETARKALSVNPRSLSSLSVLASCYWQEGDRDAYEEIRKQAFGINPAYGEFYVTVARACENKRRNEEAMELLKESLSLTPDSARSHTMVGVLLMREGEEQEAEKHLQRAYRLDRYNPRTVNFLKLLRHMKENFLSTRTGHFLIKWEREKGDLLGHFLPEYLEEAYAEVCGEFGYEPRNPTLVEIFDSHDQFSARIVGLPHIATVGASLGKVVALDSPKRGRFDWKDVLRHEFIHVVTLQQSKMQIPFWLTEGLATYHEKSPRPGEWDGLLVRMLYLGEIIPLAELNSYFTRPKSGVHKQAAYAESLVICEYLYQEFGREVIQEMIEMYGDNFRTDDVVPKCLSMSQSDFERQIEEYVFAQARRKKVPPLFMPGDEKLIEERLKEKPEDAFLTIAQARWLFDQARGGVADQKLLDEAERIISELVEKDPRAPGAYTLLAGFYLSRKDYENAEDAALKAIDVDEEDSMAHTCLGHLYETIGDTGRAIEAFKKAVKFHPQASNVWARLSLLYAKRNDKEGRIRSLKGSLLANPRNVHTAKELASLYLSEKEFNKTLEILERALRCNLYDAEIYKLLVEALRPEGNEELATKYAKLGAEAAYLTARSLPPLQTAKMKEFLKMALELDPDHENAKAFLKQIGGSAPEEEASSPPQAEY